MKGTLKRPARAKVPWLRVLLADGRYEEADEFGSEADRRDRAEQNRTEEEMFWAGRTLAMRRSARVAA